MKYRIAVSGAAETDVCKECAMDLTKELGREIIRQGGILITGATTGVPYWAAIGAKEVNGFVVGLSPASSEIEHVKKYQLPVDYHDIIIYTGFGYAGRNLLMTRSSDAVIISCGRIGTLNEFTIAFEDRKPIGVLIGTGGMAERIKEIVESSGRKSQRIIYEKEPKKLVEELIKLIELEKGKAEPTPPY
jgi:uncharacterized protein (TIGR00725 family)